MARSRKLKITPVLVALNVLVLLVIATFYITRLAKYYIIENGTKETPVSTEIYDVISKKQSYVDLTKGLVYDEKSNIYRYIGNVTDNYVLYSGILYRIVLIDNENNIKLVSDKSVTMMYSGLEKGYNNSYINKWLNKSDAKWSGVFESTLYNSEELLANTYICNDVVTDLSKITCDDITNDNKLAILSLYDYKESGGKEGYLNNGESFYLNTLNEDNSHYYITSKGEVGENTITTKVFNVRPVITLNGSSLLLSGKGTKNSPYIIEKHEIKTLKDVYVGEYINYSNNTYKVVSIDGDNVKVVLNGVLKDSEGKEITSKYGSNNTYSLSKGVGYYLNNTFYKTLSNPENIAKSNYFVGQMTMANLDYVNIYNSKVSANIGLLGLSDLFVSEYNNTFTLTKGMESSSIINVINSKGYLFGDLVSSKYSIRPSFYLNGSVSIESGNGKYENPYILGVNNEEY